MPIFKYYNPYRKPNFYNYYKPPITGTNYAPNYHLNCSTDFSNKKASNIYSTNQFEEKNNNKKDINTKCKKNENVWLELLGLKLYYDDILILSLLFFLYKEEVKDEGLFLSLVLLLIS